MEELKSFTILKKGKYGFYKNVEVEGLSNIYDYGGVSKTPPTNHNSLHDYGGVSSTPPTNHNSLHDFGGVSKTPPTNHNSLHDFGGVSSTNHNSLHDFGGVSSTNHNSLHDFGGVSSSTPLIEGLDNDFSKNLESNAESSAEGDFKVKSSSSDVRNKYGKKVDTMEEDIQSINEAGKTGDIMEVLYNLGKLGFIDIPLFLMSWLYLIDITSHPNAFDALIDVTYKKMENVDDQPEDMDKLTEEQRAKIDMINEGKIKIFDFVYSCLFFLPVYFATENWFYFLFYGGEDMTDDLRFDNWIGTKYDTIWELFKNAVKFPVVTISHVLFLVRTKTKKVPKEVAVYVRIALFLTAFGMMMNWSNMWNSTIHNYFYTIVMTIFFIMIAFYLGRQVITLNAGGIAAGTSLLLALIIIVVVFFSLLALFGFFDGIAKMMVFLYLVFHSFAYIGFKNGFGGGLTKITEIHNESRILYEDEYHKRTGLAKVFFFVSRLINEVWFSVCVMIIMGQFLGSLLLNASVPYSSLIFMISFIGIIITLVGLRIFSKWFQMLKNARITEVPDGSDEPMNPKTISQEPPATVEPNPIPEGKVLSDEEMKSLQDKLIKATNVEPMPKKVEATGELASSVAEQSGESGELAPSVVEQAGESGELAPSVAEQAGETKQSVAEPLPLKTNNTSAAEALPAI